MDRIKIMSEDLSNKIAAGEVVERIGEIVLDGSENWRLGTTKTNTQIRLMVTIVFVSCIEFTSYIIDSEPVASMVTIWE